MTIKHPQGTCANCRRITLEVISRTRPRNKWRHRHPQYECLKMEYLDIRSSSKSCPVCAVIYRTVYSHHRPKLETPVTLRFELQSSLLIHLYLSSSAAIPVGCLRLYKDQDGHDASEEEQPWDSLFNKLKALPLLAKPSPSTEQKIQRWLTECDLTHQRCKTGLSGESVDRETMLPTRLLFVGLSPDSKRKLAVTKGLRGTYTTLSHRWGGKALVQTIRANFNNHQQGVGLERLPKTFEDAIRFTQMIGVPYIWIDSLCIVQDDPQDWANEARQMGTIYEKSYLTIAASSGIDSESGLYDTCGYRMVKLPVETGRIDGGHFYLSGIFENFGGDVTNGSLAQRGWMLQEWVLSRRTLFFGISQIHRVCYHTNHEAKGSGAPWAGLTNLFNSEEYTQDESLASPVENDLLLDSPKRLIHHPLGLIYPPEEPLLPTTFDMPRNNSKRTAETTRPLHQQFHQAWGSLVGYYSSRALTVTSDREIALEGIKERLQTRLGFDYCNGHWNDNSLCFIKSLSWAVSISHSIPTGGRRAPTWSWLAEERSVFYVGTWYHLKWSAFGIEDLGMLLTSTSSASSSEELAPLRVTGVLKHIIHIDSTNDDYLNYGADNLHGSQVQADPHRAHGSATPIYLFRTYPPSEPLGCVRFDSTTIERQRGKLYCCPLYLEATTIPCLVLRELEVEGEPARGGMIKRFERVGIALVSTPKTVIPTYRTSTNYERSEEKERLSRFNKTAVAWLQGSRRTEFEIV